MKKKILLAAFVVICLAIITTGTLAFFTTEETAHNVITTGNVDIAVVETTLDDNGDEIEFPKEGFDGVMPGTSVSKIVRLENIGKGNAWVRIKVDLTAKAADGSELPLQQDGTDVMTLDYDTEEWTYSDGYYYYNKILTPGEKTTALFESVAFSKDMGNDYKSGQLAVIINAHAVQSDNNPVPTEGVEPTVAEAKGWPDA